MAQRKHLAAVLATLLLATLLLQGCTKDPPPQPAKTILPSDRVSASPVGTSASVLQKTFNLKVSAVFPFEIPAHAAQPHLHGIFESFVGQVHGASDDSANIDFLIMNEDQQADFAGNRAGEALFSVEASHNQAVNFDLPSSMSHPVKYYLVFRNPQATVGKIVEANMRVDF
jgi:hypothetical protein